MSIVFTEDRGHVRHVVLNRPEKRNAMNQELLLALGAALREAAADPSVHCVVLRGEGPVFSAGVDLVELADSASRPGMLRPFRKVFLDCANFCEEMAKPVVCQIHRTCVGGALEVALGCDLRIASSDASFGLPEVKFGIIPDVGGSTRLPAVVGLGRAKELIMTARTIDGERGRAHRPGQPRRRARGARAGDAGARRRAACQLAHRGRPRQARDRRLRAPGARADAGDGGGGAGVLRRGGARAARARLAVTRRTARATRSPSRSLRARELGSQRRLVGSAAPAASLSEARRPLAASRGLARRQSTGPATSVWLPSGRPRISCARRAQASSASRSMPVSMPISCSIETRSSLAMLPVAPAGTGQPPSSPKLDSKLSTPASSAASTFARPCPRVLWKVRGQLHASLPPSYSRSARGDAKNSRT